MAEVYRNYKLFSQVEGRSYSAYNKTPDGSQLPRIIVICRWHEIVSDILEDILIQISGVAHLSGIHLFLYYDYAGAKYLPPSVKANLPNRLVFKTTSAQDSKFAGVSGAEKLSGNMAILDGIGEHKNTKLTSNLLRESTVQKIIASILK
jgi:DNA segregation ATPase FtsK/SpoIIIE-like protein